MSFARARPSAAWFSGNLRYGSGITRIHHLPFTDDDEARAAALKPYGVLDTPADPAFDELTWLAAHACETDIALIVLADGAGLWPKSASGSPPPQQFLSSPVLRALALQQ